MSANYVLNALTNLPSNRFEMDESSHSMWRPTALHHPSARSIHILHFLQLLSRLVNQALPNATDVISTFDVITCICWATLLANLIFRLICEHPWCWPFLDHVPKRSVLAYRLSVSFLLEAKSGRWLSALRQFFFFDLPPSIYDCLGYVWDRCVQSVRHVRTKMFLQKCRGSDRGEDAAFVAAPEQQSMDRLVDSLDDASGLEMTVSVHDKHA
jgi:hypothetical protein